MDRNFSLRPLYLYCVRSGAGFSESRVKIEMFETANTFVPFLAIALPFMALEAILAKLKGWQYHNLKDSLCNLAILTINFVSRPLSVVDIYARLKLIEGFALFHLPDNIAVAVLALIATDFVYYWQHRYSHKLKWLWFFHEVHHSSRYFNLTTSFRLHWLNRMVAPLIFAPLILLGFKPEQVSLFFAFNLFYQFFLHTQAIGRIPLVEGILNTPSAHRVHHARNKEYLNKNFGGILILWDRFFGTYQPEVVDPKFGIIGSFESYNPFTVQFHKLALYRTVAEKLSRLLRPVRS